MSPEFAAYQQQVIKNARAMAAVFIERGCHVVSGGTDNHLFLVSFIDKGLTGKLVEETLGAVGITVNKNAVPNDPQSPFVTSGIRIGAPAVTTRGLGEAEVTELAGWMCDVIDKLQQDGEADAKWLSGIGDKAAKMCRAFPVYGR